MLDPAHLNLTRDMLLMLGGMLLIWITVVFVHFWLLDRRREGLRRR